MDENERKRRKKKKMEIGSSFFLRRAKECRDEVVKRCIILSKGAHRVTVAALVRAVSALEGPSRKDNEVLMPVEKRKERKIGRKKVKK